jgi:hypothetical protein
VASERPNRRPRAGCTTYVDSAKSKYYHCVEVSHLLHLRYEHLVPEFSSQDTICLCAGRKYRGPRNCNRTARRYKVQMCATSAATTISLCSVRQLLFASWIASGLLLTKTLRSATRQIQGAAWIFVSFYALKGTHAKLLMIPRSVSVAFVGLANSSCLFTSLPRPSSTANSSAALRATAPVRSLVYAWPCSAPLQP